ncbi:hypothetical protein ACFWBV_11875 [Streptomyces sp. NPDC060030]|uniref:hypothetical protein n=1 Tax=Streptomyces sp. NPDC060030 TaxID=3347042 RepID=UPI0036BB4A94
MRTAHAHFQARLDAEIAAGRWPPEPAYAEIAAGRWSPPEPALTPESAPFPE